MGAGTALGGGGEGHGSVFPAVGGGSFPAETLHALVEITRVVHGTQSAHPPLAVFAADCNPLSDATAVKGDIRF